MKNDQKKTSRSNHLGKSLAATLILMSTLGGGVAGVGIQSMGAWPKWLGGSYVSAVGCTCDDYTNPDYIYHWIACPIRSLWGLNDTGSWESAVHEGTSCQQHGHAN